MRAILFVLVAFGCFCLPAMAADPCCDRNLNATNAELREALDEAIALLTIIRKQVPDDNRQVLYVDCGHKYMMECLSKLQIVVRRCAVVPNNDTNPRR